VKSFAFGAMPRSRSRWHLGIDASLYTLLRTLSVTLVEKMPLQQAFLDSSAPCYRLAFDCLLNRMKYCAMCGGARNGPVIRRIFLALPAITAAAIPIRIDGDGEYSSNPFGVALQPAFSMFALWQSGDQIINKRKDEHRIQDA